MKRRRGNSLPLSKPSLFPLSTPPYGLKHLTESLMDNLILIRLDSSHRN